MGFRPARSLIYETMAKIELPYVQRFRDRHGRLRHYYRRKGMPRTPLPGLPGSREFMAAYEQACSRDAPERPHQARHGSRSLHALVAQYFQSAEFLALRPTTRGAYRRQIDKFRAQHGSKSVSAVQPRHLEAIFHSMASTPHAAANLRKRLRRVFALAVRLGWRNDNPVRDTEGPRLRTEGHIPWSDEDIGKFEARWPTGSRERLAFALLLYTGQRRSDVVKMGMQHVSEGRISVVQLKTQHRLKIKMHSALISEIAEHSGMSLLTTRSGAPFSTEGFGNWFRDAVAAAGLSNRSPHGLRKAAGRKLAEAGCTAKEIAAVLGHTTLTEVARYTRDADQVKLGDSALERWEEAEARTSGV